MLARLIVAPFVGAGVDVDGDGDGLDLDPPACGTLF